MKTIYLIKHSGPFVDIKNYEDYENVFDIKYQNKQIINGNPKSPSVYKITYNNKEVIDVELIS
jgi:hypothetical protein